ncbi:MAG: hypothetical protein ACK4TP_17905, partial [Hyphomicrobium sp.]
MSFSLVRTFLLALGITLASVTANAQKIPKEKGPARIFGQFHFFCLKHLPDLEGVERAAGFGEYDQLLGDDLAPYVPEAPYEKLLGWRYHDHGEEFILTAMRAKSGEASKKEVPAFGNGTETSCTLRVPNTKPDVLLGELTRGIGRAADKSWQHGATRVYSWTHQTPDALSFIQFHVPE